jgi:hypothetical protein
MGNQYWDEILSEEMSCIKQLLERTPNIDEADERASALAEAENRLREARMEVRLLQDANERIKLEKQLQRLGREFRVLKANLKSQQAEEEREELDMQRLGSQALSEAGVLQDETQNNLPNIKRMIEESKREGIATLKELHRNRKVIENVDHATNGVDGKLGRAEKLLKRFRRGMRFR